MPDHLTCSIVESCGHYAEQSAAESPHGADDRRTGFGDHRDYTNGAAAVLVKADGENFSYGGDISQWPDMNTPELRVLFERYMAVFNSFERLPIPVIAAVQGLCLGGGFELILPAYLAADVLI